MKGTFKTMDFLKVVWVQITLLSSTIAAFAGSYFMKLTANNTEQYIAVVAVVLLDGIFGILAGTKREGFRTYKALRVPKTLFTWILILTVVLTVEMGFKGTYWLSETLLIPFIVFQLISTLKNAHLLGLIEASLLQDLLENIDRHKTEKKDKK